ncbi:hypothetical protein [Mobilicoccus caccae]|uniref:Ribosomal protein L7/L12 C-terminal domain-containing protein n=1 Tax=Mobilicoccus caccae TaxID=1859295 RepID=A0ABQ6IYP1_9MICO|nr:hypothetical protein [Mobilicoccus caccae]GMA41819.1 hypothetical protein GCM10025883_38640 [Mobilicoccus caccae]
MLGITEMRRRIDRLEQTVRTQQAVGEQLCDRAGIDPGELDLVARVDDEERRLIAEGKAIMAIKHHRERTGSGLREAKEAIDQASRD